MTRDEIENMIRDVVCYNVADTAKCLGNNELMGKLVDIAEIHILKSEIEADKRVKKGSGIYFQNGRAFDEFGEDITDALAYTN